jgi:invasion protein IalB
MRLSRAAGRMTLLALTMTMAVACTGSRRPGPVTPATQVVLPWQANCQLSFQTDYC